MVLDLRIWREFDERVYRSIQFHRIKFKQSPTKILLPREEFHAALIHLQEEMLEEGEIQMIPFTVYDGVQIHTVSELGDTRNIAVSALKEWEGKQ